MDEPYDDLDDAARRALEVALAAAAAIGDQQCGTEYLLYGLVAGGRGDMAEIAQLFVLDALRVERAIQKVREPFTYTSTDYDGDPQLTPRATAALHTRRHDGSGPTGVFEVLFGVLSDPRSGACAVLRELGVRPEEVHRLAAYGRRHLSKEEAAVLLDALDRRDLNRHRPWWGPMPDAALTPVSFGPSPSVEVARSVTAVASVADLAANQHGFVITLTVESSRPWVLPPVVDPPEILVPGFAATRRHGPEILRFELVFADGSKVSNMNPIDRWRSERPTGPALVPLSTHWETSRPNDRRGCEYRRVLAQWWIWPLPVPGTIEVRVDWPAEVLSGLAPFDARPLVKAAAATQIDPARNTCGANLRAGEPHLPRLSSDGSAMTTGPTPSYFGSVPPTFGWRRVVELADEFKVSTPDMLRICDRLGVSVADASEWLDAETVDRMRDVIKVQGPSALLKPVVVSPPPKERPPKVKREKLPRATAPELGSVGRDGVRLRRVFAIGVIIAALALAIGVLVERWVQDVTNTDAPATVVTMTEQ